MSDQTSKGEREVKQKFQTLLYQYDLCAEAVEVISTVYMEELVGSERKGRLAGELAMWAVGRRDVNLLLAVILGKPNPDTVNEIEKRWRDDGGPKLSPESAKELSRQLAQARLEMLEICAKEKCWHCKGGLALEQPGGEFEKNYVHRMPLGGTRVCYVNTLRQWVDQQSVSQLESDAKGEQPK